MTMSIHDACRKGDLESVRSLVASNPALVDADDKHKWRPIFHAAIERHLDIVLFLIESGADLSAHDGFVLHYAGEVADNKEIVRLLVTYGALDAHVRPVDDLSRQFLASLFLGDGTRLRSLLNRYPQLATVSDGHGDCPIHHAARNGDTEIVRLLIDRHADVNAVNERGHTVLYCAGGHGHLETVRLLLESNADPTVKFTTDGKTLLEWLEQYPNDQRFGKIAQLLSEYIKKL
ncbi:ankyrin repeat domain-containing protein [Stieleria tagensis]|uniref:ankyrin repeat domain-containing protein n=1 Tax=Stieleria tagensis TaxID=2956795 RepID=UPI00209B981F|nr:ankyrin repeat domain-containing protein [Stieleria tagensis]